MHKIEIDPFHWIAWSFSFDTALPTVPPLSKTPLCFLQRCAVPIYPVALCTIVLTYLGSQSLSVVSSQRNKHQGRRDQVGWTTVGGVNTQIPCFINFLPTNYVAFQCTTIFKEQQKIVLHTLETPEMCI